MLEITISLSARGLDNCAIVVVSSAWFSKASVPVRECMDERGEM